MSAPTAVFNGNNYFLQEWCSTKFFSGDFLYVPWVRSKLPQQVSFLLQFIQSSPINVHRLPVFEPESTDITPQCPSYWAIQPSYQCWPHKTALSIHTNTLLCGNLYRLVFLQFNYLKSGLITYIIVRPTF